MLGYRLDQFNAYLELAHERERQVMRWDLVANALGFGGGEGLKRALSALD